MAHVLYSQRKSSCNKCKQFRQRRRSNGNKRNQRQLIRSFEIASFCPTSMLGIDSAIDNLASAWSRSACTCAVLLHWHIRSNWRFIHTFVGIHHLRALEFLTVQRNCARSTAFS